MLADERAPHMPSDVTPDVGWFDRLATRAAEFASKAWFFSSCLVLVVLWAPSYFVVGSLDTWQLLINTATTIVTFLLVALLQNSQSRADRALQDKLNAVAAGLAVLLESIDRTRPDGGRAAHELRQSVGIEDLESS